MAFLVGGANTLSDSGYTIDNSLRFNDGDSPSLHRTPSSETNKQIWTWSAWFKRSDLSQAMNLWTCGDDVNNRCHFDINSSGTFQVEAKNGGTEVLKLENAGGMVLRDPSAWYHLVWRVDTTQSTAGNRVRIYINGSELTFTGSNSQPDQNTNLEINVNSVLHAIGRRTWATENYFDGYLAEVHFADGQSYAPTVFGETNDNGVWIPKDCKADITYGTNGYFLEFKETGTSQNSSGIGADTSGEDNHFAVSNLAATDICTDSPTNNFATFNPIDVGHNLSQTTYSEGNCKVVKSGTTSDNGNQPSTSMAFSKGKWYCEIKDISNMENTFVGVFNDVLGGLRPYHNNYFYGLFGSGNESNSQIYESQEGAQKGYGIDNGTCWSTNDIIQLAFDADNYRLYIGRNGSWTDDNAASGGTITSGSDFNQSTPTGYYQISTSAAQAGFWRMTIIPAGGAVDFTAEINFGNPSFSISSGNADANGYGNFEHAVPSGFYALCSKNLAEYG